MTNSIHLVSKTAKIIIKNVYSLFTVVRPNVTLIKKQKSFFHGQRFGYIIMVLLLIDSIRSWPYMRIPAQSEGIDVSRILLKYIQNHMAYAEYNDIVIR